MFPGEQSSQSRRIVFGAGIGDLVDELVVVGTRLTLISVGHTAPFVPVQHFLLAERREVADDVAADLGWPPGEIDTGNPELLAVDQTLAVLNPCLATGQELTRSEILGMLDIRLAEVFGVDAHPAPLFGGPVLGDPVVDAAALQEVGPEAAPGPRGDAPRSQECAGDGGEVSACADHPCLGGASLVQRGWIEGDQGGDQLADRSDVLLREPCLRNSHCGGVRGLNDQALRGGADTNGVIRQALDELELRRVQAREGAGLRVVEHVIGHNRAWYAAALTSGPVQLSG